MAFRICEADKARRDARPGASGSGPSTGGGGYLLALAPDPAVAAEIRDALRRAPPNPGARFVSPSLSPGLQITRS